MKKAAQIISAQLFLSGKFILKGKCFCALFHVRSPKKAAASAATAMTAVTAAATTAASVCVSTAAAILTVPIDYTCNTLICLCHTFAEIVAEIGRTLRFQSTCLQHRCRIITVRLCVLTDA